PPLRPASIAANWLRAAFRDRAADTGWAPLPRSTGIEERKQRSARRQHHHHLAAFELWFSLDLGDRADLLAHLLQELHAELEMRHLAAAETQGELHLVALLEEPAHRLHLHLVVVDVDVGA